jgi:hypothetical protein
VGRGSERRDGRQHRRLYGRRLVWKSKFYVYNLHLDNGIVYALAEDGLYKITVSTGAVVKDVNIELPNGYNSALVFGNTTYVATDDALLSRRTFEDEWHKLFDLSKAFVRATSNLTFCVGRNPLDDTASLVYYSHSGVVWNRSTSFADIGITGVTQRYDNIYYASDSGLLIEDLSRLFSQSDDLAPTITVALLEGDDGENEDIVVNDVDADATKVVAGTNTGKIYTLIGQTVSSSAQSRLESIHKVRVIDGKYWLFGYDQIDIEDVDQLVHLSVAETL